jgi:peptide/nickel transport system substrate-binding protein
MQKKLWIIVALVTILTMVAGCAPATPEVASPTATPVSEEQPAEPEATEEPDEAPAESEPTEESAADEEVTLTVGIASDPDTLNVLVSNEINTSLMLNNTYPTLMLLDENGNKYPYIIEEPEISDDGLEMIIRVKDDIYWTDGEPITAQDIVWTYDAIWEGKFHWTYTVLDGITWEATDDKTVVFTLSKPFPKFISQIGFWVRIVPSHVWSQAADVQNFIDEDFVGFGPFQLTDYQTGEYYMMERVPDFPFAPTDDKAYIDTIIFQPFPDPNTMVLALKTGDIDVAARPLTSEAATELAGSEDLNLESAIDLGYEHMHFNLTDELLSDVVVREAIAMAVDRQKIANFAYGGNAEPMPGPISPLYTQFDFGITYPEFDIEGAKALLAENGYEDTDGDGIVNAPSGENLSFELIYAVNYVEHEKIAAIIAEDAKQIGIELVPKGFDKPVQLEQLYKEPKGENNYQISINTWGIIDDVEASMSNLYLPESNLNWMNWVNEEAVEAMKAMSSASDQDVIDENMTAFQTAITTDIPDVSLVVKGNMFAYRNNFAGFTVYPDDLKGLITPQNMWSVYKISE